MTEGNNNIRGGERPFKLSPELQGGPPSLRRKFQVQPPMPDKRNVPDRYTLERKHSAPLPRSRFPIKKSGAILIQLPTPEVNLDESDFVAELADDSHISNTSYAKINLAKENIHVLTEPEFAAQAKVPDDEVPYADIVKNKNSDQDIEMVLKLVSNIREAAIYAKDFFDKTNNKFASELLECVISDKDNKFPTQQEALAIAQKMGYTTLTTIEVNSIHNNVQQKLKEYLNKPLTEIQQESVSADMRREFTGTALIPKPNVKKIPYVTNTPTQSKSATETASVSTNISAQVEEQKPKGFFAKFSQKITRGIAILGAVLGLKTDEASKLPPPVKPAHIEAHTLNTSGEDLTKVAETLKSIQTKTSNKPTIAPVSKRDNKEQEDSKGQREVNHRSAESDENVVVIPSEELKFDTDVEKRLEQIDPKKNKLSKTPPPISHTAKEYKAKPLQGEELDAWKKKLNAAMREAKLATMTPEQIKVLNEQTDLAVEQVEKGLKSATDDLETAANNADTSSGFDKEQFNTATQPTIDTFKQDMEQIQILNNISPDLQNFLNTVHKLKINNSKISDQNAIIKTLGTYPIALQLTLRKQARELLKNKTRFNTRTTNILKYIAT